MTPRALRTYFCPRCRRRHLCVSRIGRLHGVYVQIAVDARQASPDERGRGPQLPPAAAVPSVDAHTAPRNAPRAPPRDNGRPEARGRDSDVLALRGDTRGLEAAGPGLVRLALTVAVAAAFFALVPTSAYPLIASVLAVGAVASGVFLAFAFLASVVHRIRGD